MYALVYHGPGEKSWEEVPDPGVVDDTDAVVRVDSVVAVIGAGPIGSTEDPVAAVGSLTDERGADVTVEAVGVPETFELAVEMVRSRRLGWPPGRGEGHRRPGPRRLVALSGRNGPIATNLAAFGPHLRFRPMR